MSKKQKNLIDLIRHQVGFSLFQFTNKTKSDTCCIRKFNLSQF